jgi:hypothetical protein
MVRGVRFLVDDAGRKTAVQIDLKRQGRLREDLYDRALAEQRASEPREPLDAVKPRVLGRRRTWVPSCLCPLGSTGTRTD